MLYVFLAVACVLLPWIRRYGIVPFSFIILALPVGNAFSLYFYKGGLFFFDFYFMSLFLRFMFQRQISGHWAILGGTLIAIYAAIAIAGGTSVDLYFLRDFRLLLYLVMLICLMSLHTRGIIISGNTLKMLAVTAGASCILYSSMTAAGMFSFEDEFYVRNAFRYFSVASYFCFGFFALNSFLPAQEKRDTLFYVALLASLVGIALTGARVMSFSAFMLFLAGSIRSKRGASLSLILLFAGAPILLASDDGSSLSRLLELSPKTILHQIQNRYLPFILEYTHFGQAEVILGGGYAQTFEIPWFSHREAKDSINNFVDSTYLTLYAKFGIFSLFLLFVYIMSFARLLQPGSGRASGLLIACLAILWIVYSLPYQMASIGLSLVVFCIGAASRKLTFESATTTDRIEVIR